MPLLPLKIPAGVYKNGTDYEASGRWIDADLVRWNAGSLRPVGGWVEKFDISADTTATPRKMHTWIDNLHDSTIAVATCNELLYVNQAGTVFDITPTGFNAGTDTAEINSSYGGGYYGGSIDPNDEVSLYGKQQPSTGVYQEVDTCSLDNWGEYLLFCSTGDGKLYEWQGDGATPAAQIANSPEQCSGLVVTNERFVFALQAGGNPRNVAWCDREDNTTWTGTAENEAGEIELQTSGEIMFGLSMRGRTLIVTNVDAHIATYQGAPYVYGFEKAGSACGAASRMVGVAIDEGAFWMGSEAFYVFDGSAAKQINCDVADYVFDDMNKNQITKAWGIHNSEYGEIWWFYPSSASNECDRYVAYNYREGHWLIGRLDRTCGVDQGVYTDPLWVDSSGTIYRHELHGVSHGTHAPPYAETAPISLGNGDQVMRVTEVIPDEGTVGDVRFVFGTRFYPNSVERNYDVAAGSWDSPASVRFTGRQVRMKVIAENNNDFRVGTVRLKVSAGGTR